MLKGAHGDWGISLARISDRGIFTAGRDGSLRRYDYLPPSAISFSEATSEAAASGTAGAAGVAVAGGSMLHGGELGSLVCVGSERETSVNAVVEEVWCGSGRLVAGFAANAFVVWSDASQVEENGIFAVNDV